MQERPYINQQNWGKDLVGRLRGGQSGEYLLSEEEGIALFEPIGSTNRGINFHLSEVNPHGISIEIIGAAPAVHTHTGAQVSGDITGNAANITGIAAVANGGTGASTAASALTNLGAAAAVHTHAEIIDHLSAVNPHQISPDSIGAAFVSHIHTGSHIFGNITGNAANITGIAAIANGGTGASTAASALTNLGAASAVHTHAEIIDHLSAVNPHQISPDSIGAAFSWHTHDDLADHLSEVNPHGISIEIIGAAPAVHTHTGSQVSGNISGNAANITGIAAIANGGTGASTAAAALTNLGAAPIVHTHTGSQVSGNISGNAANITGIAAIANGGTGASTAAAALTNLGAATTNIAVTLNTGWVEHGFGWLMEVDKFSRLVVVTGLVARNSGTNNTICVLPSNCRPITNVMTTCLGYWSNTYYQCRVDFLPNGNVTLTWASATIPSVITFVHLNAVFVTSAI